MSLKSGLRAVTAAFALLAMAEVAAAATVVFEDVAPPYPSSGGVELLPTSSTGSVGTFTTSEINVRRSPYEGSDFLGTDDGLYTFIQKNSSATFDFGGVFTAISIFFGSPDTYNLIEFFNGSAIAANLVDTFTGTQASSTEPPLGEGSTLLTIMANLPFTTVRLTSIGQEAFEFSNLSAVPIPPALALFATGLAGMGLLARRRKGKANATLAA